MKERMNQKKETVYVVREVNKANEVVRMRKEGSKTRPCLL
jgi:hypothetical protein